MVINFIYTYLLPTDSIYIYIYININMYNIQHVLCKIYILHRTYFSFKYFLLKLHCAAIYKQKNAFTFVFIIHTHTHTHTHRVCFTKECSGRMMSSVMLLLVL